MSPGCGWLVFVSVSPLQSAAFFVLFISSRSERSCPRYATFHVFIFFLYAYWLASNQVITGCINKWKRLNRIRTMAATRRTISMPKRKFSFCACVCRSLMPTSFVLASVIIISWHHHRPLSGREIPFAWLFTTPQICAAQNDDDYRLYHRIINDQPKMIQIHVIWSSALFVFVSLRKAFLQPADD